MLLAGGFVVFLWLPTLDSWIGIDRAPRTNENRSLVKWPDPPAGPGAMKNYFTALEVYFNDHFGFRNRLVRWYHRWKQEWFRESSNPEVLIGKDGWLFVARKFMVEHYLGLLSFTKEDLEAWRFLLESRRNWLADRGIAYVFTVPPNKGIIYREFTPEWMGPTAVITSKHEQLVKHLHENASVLPADPRPALLEKKSVRQVYLFTDTHWNNYGAYLGYQEVMKALRSQRHEYAPLPWSAFEWRPMTNEPGGDLTILLGRQANMREHGQVEVKPRPPLVPVPRSVEPSRLAGSWEPGHEPIVQRNPAGQGKAVVFRDSFASPWMEFLGHHFAEVIYIWDTRWDLAFLEKEKPDVVIDEIQERSFDQLDPRTLLHAPLIKSGL